MITEQYVEFETAKLLKEKEFNIRCRKGYWPDKQLCLQPCSNSVDAPVYACPTQSLAMRWLREVHNIDIIIEPHSYAGIKVVEYEFMYWYLGDYHTPYQEKDPEYHPLFGKTWDSYEQAAESAIKYCLENLI